MSERPSSSNAGEEQAVGRISVKDRLGPLPPEFSQKRRARSAERNHKRGRKFSKSAQAPEANVAAGGHHKPATARIPVHERLGPLPAQAFKKNNDLFQKRNRQQVWRHQSYNKGPQQQPQAQAQPQHQPKPLSKEPEPELQQRSPVDIAESVKFSNPNPKPAVPHHPTVQPFNAEQHRQTWTWTRPAANSSAMEIDDST